MDKLNAILRQFDQAAATYEDNSDVQRAIASALIRQLDQHAQNAPQSILELGCGTGNLTRLLTRRCPAASILATDASERMLAEAAKNVDANGVRFQPFVISPTAKLDGQWDWLVSNMTLQWMDDLDSTLQMLARHAHHVAFTIPVDGTFANWKSAHQSLGLQDGVQDFVTESALTERLSSFSAAHVSVQDFPVAYRHPIDFVRSLRLMGGSTPKTDHRPVTLRAVFRQFPAGLTVNYRIALVVLKAHEQRL